MQSALRAGQVALLDGEEMIKSSKRTRQRRRKIKDLDLECREIVFTRDGNACVKCGKTTGKLDWAHIVSRRDITLRHDPENSLVLCAGCHFFWHHAPLEAVTWFQQKFPLRYEYMMEVRRTVSTVRL